MSPELWNFATTNPVIAFLMIWVAAWAITRPFWYAFIAYNRMLRSRNIRAQGWPTAPLDADGDVVYPDKSDQKETA